MKKLVSLFMACVALTMFSCQPAKVKEPLATLDGEWKIVSVNGVALDKASAQEDPFIGFDTKTGRMFGFSGCNRLMASFDTDEKPGELDLGSIGSTRMACPDLTLEHNILSALDEVKKFAKDKDGRIELCDEKDKCVLLLEKIPPFSVSNLQGKWLITQVDNTAVPTDMENQPFIEFDVKANRIHGNAGCNVMNGEFKTDANDAALISFPGVITTMMACPDMELEGKILAAINSVQSFAKVPGGVGLFNATGEQVLTIEQQ